MLKNIFIKTALSIILSLSLLSCSDYLDVVPDETAKVEDFFVNRTTAEKFLVSLYAGTKFQKVDVPSSVSVATASDFIYCSYPARPHGAIMGDWGTWSSSSTQGDIWSDNAFVIRQAYVFLENIDGVSNIGEAERNQWKAEAKFLIAYLHFQMLRQYGPIYLAENIYSLNETMEELMVKLYRHPYDECVEWIVALLEEASEGLPATMDDLEPSYYGKPTRIAALSLAARLRLYAASPLFNGNTDYADFVDNDGVQLINQNYDASKWELAEEACKRAIDVAEAAGHHLIDDKVNGYTNYRMAATEAWNDELIWGSTYKTYSKSSAGYIMKNTMPLYVTANDEQVASNESSYKEGWFEFTATLKSVELFYTKNGLPIEDDPDFDYSRRYTLVESTAASELGQAGEQTLLLHENRSPRFYASLGYDRGAYLSASDTTILNIRMTEKHGISAPEDFSKLNSPVTGYYIQKWIHPNHSWSTYFGQEEKYPWPLIRLAELYLSYAEALNEVGNNQAEAIIYINKVRTRANIPTLEASWKKASFSQDELRKIIQRERSIELCYEGHRQWDMKRWKRLEEMYEPAEGLNIVGADVATFNVPRIIAARTFDNRFYLYPIGIVDLQRNTSLVQNPNW